MSASPTLELEVPSGDPATLRATASRLTQAAGNVRTAGDGIGGDAAGMSGAWRGIAATAAEASLRGVSSVAGEAADSLQRGASAIGTYASALEYAQTTIRSLQAKADDTSTAFGQTARSLEQRGGGGFLDPAMLRARADAQSALGAVSRQAEEIQDDLDRAARACRRALEETRSPFVRGHRESISDYVQGIVTHLATRIPVLGEHERTVEAAVWAYMGGMSALGGGAKAIKLGWQLFRLGEGEQMVAPGFSLLQKGLLGRLGNFGQSIRSGEGLFGSIMLGTSRSANLLRVFGTASAEAGGGMRGALAGLGATGRAGGFLRAAGIAGGVVSTGVSAANVISQGNPVEAFRENGAGYVADVAETGFNASLTAFTVAPNPATAAATIGFGAVWAGAELWDHREDVGELWNNGVETAGDVLESGRDWAGDRVEDVGDTLSDVGDALNPF